MITLNASWDTGALLNALLGKGNLDFGMKSQEIFEIKESCHNRTPRSVPSMSALGSIGHISKEVTPEKCRIASILVKRMEIFVFKRAER